MMHLYRHFDESGTLLYVGVSISTASRLSQHRDTSHWFEEIANVTIERFETREAALAAERKAITEENPLHNLYRPRKEVVRLAAKKAAEESSKDLVRRMVQFNPMYSVYEASEVLGVNVENVRALIKNNQIGHVTLPGQSHYRISGWQLIEFIENLQEPHA